MYYEYLLGNSSRAYRDFEIALYHEQKRWSGQQFLVSRSGNQQAEFFIRFQAWKQFETVNAWNIHRCEKNRWRDKLAVSHLLQGWYEICRGQLSQAETSLAQAERILRSSSIVERICRLDWVWALLAEAKGENEEGLQRVNDALFTAADKGFRLWQADLLVLRGRLRLGMAKSNLGMTISQVSQNPAAQVGLHSASDLLEQAGDDAHETLKIAEQTGYIWPKVEALELLAAYHQTRAGFPAFNAQDEKDKAQSHANEAASIKKDLFLTEEQMQELKAQARQEFEKQIAGWKKEL